MPDSFNVGDVNVLLNIPHTWVGDLIITLTHGATTVTIVDRIGSPPGFGCSNNDLNVELDDQGSGGPIEANCVPDPLDDQFAPTSPPSYLPFATLSAFAGLDSAGDWTITVSDNAGFDTGVLASRVRIRASRAARAARRRRNARSSPKPSATPRAACTSVTTPSASCPAR